MNLKLRYFAVFRDGAGMGEEAVATQAKDLKGLYKELQARHKFSLDPQWVRFAVNGAYQPPEFALSDGDEVVLIPPVAGG